jgi:hypothetical protein
MISNSIKYFVALLGTLNTLSGCINSSDPKKHQIIARFVDENVGEVEVTAVRRVPQNMGGEENIFLTYQQNGKAAARVRIDHNGRLEQAGTLAADVSTDLHYVRVYVQVQNAAMKEGGCRYLVLSYVDLTNQEAIRPRQACQTALISTQLLEGNNIRWRAMPRKMT